MAYVTGNAADLSALRTAILNACSSNGWSVSGNIVSKSGCFVDIQVSGATLQILGGTGASGGALTGAGPSVCKMIAIGAVALTGPFTYHIFINGSPDEVYVWVNFGSSYYQHIAWGKSSLTLPGSGNWYSAFSGSLSTVDSVNISYDSSQQMVLGSSGSGNRTPAGPFFSYRGTTNISNANSFLHHALDGGTGWSGTAGSGAGGIAFAAAVAGAPLGITPNNWNGEAPLIPVHVAVPRVSSLFSLVAQLKHCRYVRIDNLNPGQIITIGSEQWMVFPLLQKNSAAREPGTGLATTHSGTYGCAIRYA